MCLLSNKNSKIDGSMSPLRVPMMRPSKGVKPMLVSTDKPFLTAVTDAPLPKWAITMHNSSGFRFSILAAVWLT